MCRSEARHDSNSSVSGVISLRNIRKEHQNHLHVGEVTENYGMQYIFTITFTISKKKRCFKTWESFIYYYLVIYSTARTGPPAWIPPEKLEVSLCVCLLTKYK